MTKNQIKNIKSGDIIVYSSRNFAYLVLEYLKHGYFNVIVSDSFSLDTKPFVLSYFDLIIPDCRLATPLESVIRFPDLTIDNYKDLI